MVMVVVAMVAAMVLYYIAILYHISYMCVCVCYIYMHLHSKG
jgi:hypothetical protein